MDGRKVKQAHGYTQFMHRNFRRDRPDLVETITRKQSNGRRYGKKQIQENPEL
ncbi:hypothetical protein EV175_005123, partial [Coemansia sp. RSA 1933]